MSAIKENAARIQHAIAKAALQAGRRPEEITLLAATKTRTPAEVREVIAAGITTVGENRVQEMTEKLGSAAYDGASLHFIGRLQTNKVKLVVGRAALIHSVDSPRLAAELEKASARVGEQTQSGFVQEVLVEVNIGGEHSKGGIEPRDLPGFLQTLAEYGHLRVRGLMCIPPPAETPEQARRYFAAMRELFERSRALLAQGCEHVLSMGMSDDYEQAVLEGSTLVRVGTALFGPRNYR